jgi:F-type H+-transporting ATPase subunit delta
VRVADARGAGSGVAERYATALFDLAVEQKAVKDVEGELDQIAALISESPDMRRLIASPVFSAGDQANALVAVFDRAGVKGLAANFGRVMAGNRRLFVLPDAIAAFKRLAAKQRGEVSAEVVSAEPLSERHIADLKAALKASLGKDVALTASVDASLIGGLIVKVGSRMIDDSLKTKLSSLKLAMKGTG